MISELTPVQISHQCSLPLFVYNDNGGASEEDEHSSVDLRDLLVLREGNSFAAHYTGFDLHHVGVCSGDWLIVDRACKPQDGDLVIASNDSDWVCGILNLTQGILTLGEDSAELRLCEHAQLTIEGVVVHSIRQQRR